MEKLLIFPFNGNGIEALDCAEGQYDFIGFIDDTIEKQGKHKLGFQVFDRSVLRKYREAKVLAVPGSPLSYKIRAKTINNLLIPIDRYARVIHPNSTISKQSSIGYNTLIMAGVVITSNAKIGNHVCILPNSTIHHDSIVNDFTLIGSNVTVAGNTTIEENCYIGSGSNIINNITIGGNTLVGLGSNVINQISSNQVVVGNPARK